MKKFLGIVLVFALLLPVLAGCQSAAPTAQLPRTHADLAGGNSAEDVTPIPAADPVPTETDPATRLTRDEVLEIALKDAGLTKEEIRDLEIELDRDDGTLHFDVDFEKDDKDYDYEIDADTGKILRKEVPPVPVTPAATETTKKEDTSSTKKEDTSKRLSRNEVRDIALKHAGLSVSQVRDLDIELDRDDGTLHYDVDFEADGYEYDYEIDPESGKILRSYKERD